MSKRLDTAANVAIILTCVVVSLLVVFRYFDTRQRSGTAISGYNTGAHMDRISGVNYSDAPATMLLFIRSTCHFCTESMAFYRSLADLDVRKMGRLRLVAVSSESAETTNQYLQTNRVAVDDISMYTDARVPATPTLVLIDSTGVILGQWRGLLQKSGESEVIDNLKQAASSSAVSFHK